MCVFSALANNGTVTMHLIAIGRAFHNREPTTLNERSPKLTSFARGTSNWCCCDERVQPVSLACRQDTAVPCRWRRSILNSMRRFMGSLLSDNWCDVVTAWYPGSDVLYSLELFQVFERKSSQKRISVIDPGHDESVHKWFGGFRSNVTPDTTNVMKVHVRCSANRLDMICHAQRRIRYDTRVANVWWWAHKRVMMSSWTCDDQLMNVWWWARERVMMSSWTCDDELMNVWWWAHERVMMGSWTCDDALMKVWCWAHHVTCDDELMDVWWWAHERVMTSSWTCDDELMNVWWWAHEQVMMSS